ncbi:MAG: hypothetical protein ACT4P4_22275 [Betaproteobacteria bacterium]
MKTLLAAVTLLLAASSAAAQSSEPRVTPAPAPDRASGLNLNLKLDDATRRSVVSEQASEQRTKTDDRVLPSLGAGSRRSFDQPTGSRPKSESGSGPFPKAVDTP